MVGLAEAVDAVKLSMSPLMSSHYKPIEVVTKTSRMCPMVTRPLVKEYKV